MSLLGCEAESQLEALQESTDLEDKVELKAIEVSFFAVKNFIKNSTF